MTYVSRASTDRKGKGKREGEGGVKSEEEVKGALKSWLRVNRWRMLVDFAGMCCALAALVEQDT